MTEQLNDARSPSIVRARWWNKERATLNKLLHV